MARGRTASPAADDAGPRARAARRRRLRRRADPPVAGGASSAVWRNVPGLQAQGDRVRDGGRVITVIGAGAMATKAGNAGNAWSRLGWTSAFRRLGFDGWCVEEVPFGPGRAAASAWASASCASVALAQRI